MQTPVAQTRITLRVGENHPNPCFEIIQTLAQGLQQIVDLLQNTPEVRERAPVRLATHSDWAMSGEREEFLRRSDSMRVESRYGCGRITGS